MESGAFQPGAYEQAWDWVQRRLPASRLLHTRGVFQTAVHLARQAKASEEKAGLAAILHDGAKNLGGPDLLSIAADERMIVDIVQQQSPDLLHGPAAAVLARRELGITDEEVLRAIAIHTTGAPGMSRLDKVLYLADYIEPGRQFPGVDEVRQVAEQDLDGAVLMAMDGTLSHVITGGRLIHPLTVEARNWMLIQLRRPERGFHPGGDFHGS